jgi:hypothetical protein
MAGGRAMPHRNNMLCCSCEGKHFFVNFPYNFAKKSAVALQQQWERAG